MYRLGINRNWQKTAVLETVLIIFLRNDCKMDDKFHGLVLVIYFLDLIASSAKVNSNSLQMTPQQNLLKIGNINHKGDHFTSSAFWLVPFMTKMNTLEMTAGNVFNLQDFEQNKI